MDMVVEYADRYKHHPATVPRMTWHEFVAFVDRTGRYEARDRLIMADAVTLGQPVDPSQMALRMMEKAGLERLAWPGKD